MGLVAGPAVWVLLLLAGQAVWVLLLWGSAALHDEGSVLVPAHAAISVSQAHWALDGLRPMHIVLFPFLVAKHAACKKLKPCATHAPTSSSSPDHHAPPHTAPGLHHPLEAPCTVPGQSP